MKNNIKDVTNINEEIVNMKNNNIKDVTKINVLLR